MSLFPSAQSVDVALRDGSTLHVRPVTASDEPAIRTFLDGLSARSIVLRFFGMPNFEWVAKWSVDVDYADRYALVATSGPEHEIVAHAAYVRINETRAEVAFLVSDAWQQRGIATILLAHLAATAEQQGISVFTAVVMPENHRMIGVFRESGFRVALHSTPGGVEIELPTSLSEEALAHFDQRDQIAANAALRHFLEPRSIALLGASRRRGTVGSALLRSLVAFGYTGSLHLVNSRARTIQGRPVHHRIGDVPEPVDLAVIAVPAATVPGVARDCAAAGVRALLVISSGFAESGAEGAARQAELLEICRDSGMRLIGPNCLGVLNTAPDVRLDATFAASAPLPGRLGFVSQSGGLGIAMLESAERLGVGFSSFVSVGNKADISGNDLLDYWENDSRTDVVLLYLESFGNPRRFARIARRVGASKPILAVKSGRSPAGMRATSSHTGALVAASDVTVDALFGQAGVIRTDTLRELFDVAGLMSAQPAPAGTRVAIVTNAGGPGILCADACQDNGLDVVELAPEVRERLASFLPAEASVSNPIDTIATASAKDYRRTLETLIDARACDAIVTIFVPALVTRARDVARAVRQVAKGGGDATLAAVFMMGATVSEELRSGQVRVPTFEFPEEAARALAHAARYSAWRARPGGSVVEFPDTRPDEAAAVVASALAGGSEWLAPDEVWALLGCYGLPLVPSTVVQGAREAARAASALGGPVALKAIGAGLIHKTDAGGVRLGLEGDEAVRGAAAEIRRAVRRAGHRLDGLVVQPMVKHGVELLMGVVHDPSFGPVIACGAGGTSAELFKDVAVRITPLTDLDAREMLRSLRSFPLLDGYRGAPACDVAAIEDTLLRLSALVDAHAEIAELDANPVVADPAGAVIVDARVRLHPARPRRPVPSLSAE